MKDFCLIWLIFKISWTDSALGFPAYLPKKCVPQMCINPQYHEYSRQIYSAMDIINASVAMSSFFHS